VALGNGFETAWAEPVDQIVREHESPFDDV
jgi:hypothetical protein